LPDTAVITQATLRLKEQSVVGSPFSGHGFLRFDIRMPFFGASDALALTDFQLNPSSVWFGHVNPISVGGWHNAGVRPNGFALINLTGTTQFRLRFGIGDDSDLVADYVKFYSGNAALTIRPQFIVQFYVP
jgi:hypothetical protein